MCDVTSFQFFNLNLMISKNNYVFVFSSALIFMCQDVEVYCYCFYLYI